MRRLFSVGIMVGFILTYGSWSTVWAAGQKPAATKAADGKTLKNPTPATPASIAAGKQIFTKNCSTCHGVTAKGDGPMAPEGTHPANMTDDKWDFGGTDGEIFVTIRDGVEPKYDMDTWEGTLSEKDMWNVINYIRSLGPKAAK